LQNIDADPAPVKNFDAGPAPVINFVADPVPVKNFDTALAHAYDIISQHLLNKHTLKEVFFHLILYR
jgi:hypothetical protein